MAVLATGLGACSSQSTGRFASVDAAAPSGATVAFESIDGPPPNVFSKLVASLDDEARAQSIAVVSRNDAATYRVRGYVSAMIERNRTTFGWVWDVYDVDKRRALRITGEEPARTPGRGRDTWAAADDAVLRRIAHDGMEKIAAFLQSPPPAPAAAPENPLPTLVARRDDSPEAAGIFRMFGSHGQEQDLTTGSTAAAAQPETDAAPPPVPPKTRKRKTAHASAAAPSTDGRSSNR